jgi:hypothetical protein
MAQSGTIEYAVVEGWEQLPTSYVHRDVAGVAVDGEDRVYLICRGDHPVLVYDQQGNFLRSWGEGAFTARTHGISVGPNGTIFCTDDGNHTVRQFTPEGKLLLTLAACRRENAMAKCKALSLVRSRPLTQKNHLSVSESILVREAFLPVWSLSTIAYALPRSS